MWQLSHLKQKGYGWWEFHLWSSPGTGLAGSHKQTHRKIGVTDCFSPSIRNGLLRALCLAYIQFLSIGWTAAVSQVVRPAAQQLAAASDECNICQSLGWSLVDSWGWARGYLSGWGLGCNQITMAADNGMRRELMCFNISYVIMKNCRAQLFSFPLVFSMKPMNCSCMWSSAVVLK